MDWKQGSSASFLSCLFGWEPGPLRRGGTARGLWRGAEPRKPWLPHTGQGPRLAVFSRGAEGMTKSAAFL